MAHTTPKTSTRPKVAEKVNLTKLQEANPTIRFNATLSPPKPTASWTPLPLPKSASAKLQSTPSQDTTMVEGTINGFAFRAALESPSKGSQNGKASHFLKLSKALQDAAGAAEGDTVTVEITRIGDEPECRVPIELRKALEAAPSAQALWMEITPMARRDWVLSISAVKQEETRVRRVEMTCDMLASGKRRPCCFPGINWRRKDSDVTSEETWLPLPNSKSRKT